jgi:hypothetical protein
MGRTSCEERPGRGEGAAGPALFGPRPASHLCSFAHWRRRRGTTCPATEEGPALARSRHGARHGAYDNAKSSALLGSALPLPSPAGPWGRPDGFFQSGFWRPKWCQWGPFRIRTARCSFQNRPRRARENVGTREILTPFGRAPLPPLQCGVGWGGPASPPRPHGSYIYYICKREKSPPTQILPFPERKTGFWGCIV